MEITDASIDQVIRTLEAIKGTGVRCLSLVVQGPTGVFLNHMHPGVAGFASLSRMLSDASESAAEKI